MSFTPTRFRKVTPFQDASGKRVLHDVDQFQWYSDGLQHARKPDSIDLWSEVMFVLPPVAKSRNFNYLRVLGNGIDECQAYLFGFRGDVNGRPQSAVWNLFDYQNRSEGGQLPLSIPTVFPPKFANVFTTEITPFLHVGNVPPEAHRVYNFQLFGSDVFQLTAIRGDAPDSDKLLVQFIEDGKARASPTVLIPRFYGWGVEPGSTRLEGAI